MVSIKMPENNPARRSSIKIPAPFLIFLSIHEIGHSFTMSKKRKNKKSSFPTIDDGVAGIKFIYAAKKSSNLNSKWIKI